MTPYPFPTRKYQMRIRIRIWLNPKKTPPAKRLEVLAKQDYCSANLRSCSTAACAKMFK